MVALQRANRARIGRERKGPALLAPGLTSWARAAGLRRLQSSCDQLTSGPVDLVDRHCGICLSPDDVELPIDGSGAGRPAPRRHVGQRTPAVGGRVVDLRPDDGTI